MADQTMESCIDTFRRTNLVARQLALNPGMPWDDLQEQTLCLRREHDGLPCPSLVLFLQFLMNLSFRSSQWFFSSVNVLMVTMTSERRSFCEVMGYFEKMEESCKRRGIVDDEVPPPIPGVPNPRYSTDRWKLLKQVHQFQTSLCPVRLRCVLSSRNMMMTSTAQVGFFFQCVMRGSNPRLKIRTVAPGMFIIFLRRFLKNAAESGQSTSLIRIIAIFAEFYGLNPRILRKILEI